ncbi:GFA family protein [Roseitranquillus sediminis]|uniref:GFA family protein n=1 Tax=Roseitranquillus sediminis TaxID=2809051 RepID=UPI001D0CD586|nr:GFA family protein [Roseitranquillus sediminis]MBM9596141.1 GFA family protein [Roseitranquillus sediminis]
MHLDGSCHCGAVRFSVESRHPYPFALCYCSICRKTAGGGGFAINLGASTDTLRIEGEAHVRTYRARMHDDATGEETQSEGERKFCGLCGSALWLWDPRWPELVHPHASAIDTDLPVPPERTHLMLGSKATWVEPCVMPQDQPFEEYPEESLEAWHKRLGLER